MKTTGWELGPAQVAFCLHPGQMTCLTLGYFPYWVLLVTILRPWSCMFGELGKEMPVFPWGSHYSWWDWPALWLLGALCWPLVLAVACSVSCAYYLSACTAEGSNIPVLTPFTHLGSSSFVVAPCGFLCSFHWWWFSLRLSCISLQLVVPLLFIWGRRCVFTSLWEHFKKS